MNESDSALQAISRSEQGNNEHQNKINPLTSVRFIAAILVVLHHTAPMPEKSSFFSGLLFNLIDLGFTSVGFFFVLSGFILAIVYPVLPNRRALAEFWSARIARIYPIYIMTLLADLPRLLLFRIAKYGIIAGALSTSITLGLQATMLSAVFPVGTALNFPSWSVATEAFFYLFFPVLLLCLGRPDAGLRTLKGNVLLIGVFALIAVLIPLITAFILNPLDQLPDWVSRFPVLRLPEFIIGILLAKIYRLLGNPNFRLSCFLLIAGMLGWLAILISDDIIRSMPLKGALLIPFSLLIY